MWNKTCIKLLIPYTNLYFITLKRSDPLEDKRTYKTFYFFGVYAQLYIVPSSSFDPLCSLPASSLPTDLPSFQLLIPGQDHLPVSFHLILRFSYDVFNYFFPDLYWSSEAQSDLNNFPLSYTTSFPERCSTFLSQAKRAEEKQVIRIQVI